MGDWIRSSQHWRYIGFESVWTSADGFSKVTTSPKDGASCIQGYADDVLVTTNGGAGYGAAVRAEGWFRIDSENSGESNIVIFTDTTDYYGVLMLVRNSDSNTSNGTAPVKIMGKLTSSTLEQVGTVTNVNIGEWYRYVMLYDTTTNIARVDIYNSSSVSVFSTGNISATLNFTIDNIGLYASGYGNISHDAFKVNSL